MKVISRIVLWTVLAAVVLLGILSIIGAFIGVQRARALFNSLPLAIFWVLLAALLVSGLLLFKRLRHSFGLLAGHVGPALILIGAIWSSDTGHGLSRKYLDSHKIPTGYMRIFENESSNIVFDDGKEVGKLPFKIGLSDFWIEYYGEDDSTPWLLWVDAAPAEEEHGRRQETFDWAEGDKTELPLVGLKIEVLQYLPHASPGNLEVTQAGGKKTIVPADVNQEVSLDNSKGSLRIVKVFSHLIVQADHEVVNVPHSNANPALKIEFDQPGKEKSHIYVYTGAHSAHGQQIEGVKLQYLPKKDPTSPLPAMEVLLSDGDKKLHGWLVGKDPNRGASLPLTPLLGAATKPADDDGHGHDPNSYLVMARRSTPIKDYKSSLVVADEGAVVAEKVIEVNDPLHYGGYHFYQNSYDSQHGQYTVLFVKSDTGLLTVYAGFSLLCAGVFWSSWVRPGWNYLMKR